MIGRKLSEERASAEDRAAELERKWSDLTAQINSTIVTNVTDAYSAEQTLNAVSFAVFYFT